MRRKFYFTEEHPGQKGDVGCGESANRIERVPNRCGSRWSPHLTNYTPNPYQFSKESTKDTKKCRGDRPVALVEPCVESGEALLTPNVLPFFIHTPARPRTARFRPCRGGRKC